MSEWCGTTAELPNQALAKLVNRSKRSTLDPTRRTGPTAPLDHAWFEDSQPIRTDASEPIELADDNRKRSSVIEKLEKPKTYPEHRASVGRILFRWTFILSTIS